MLVEGTEKNILSSFLEKHKAKFIRHCADNGLTEGQAEYVLEDLRREDLRF